MKSLTFEQFEPLRLTAEQDAEPFVSGPFTFSIMRPWALDAWEVVRLMEEAMIGGDDFAMPIRRIVHLVDEESGIDFHNTTAGVYKQFVFPNKTTGDISFNIRQWLAQHRSYALRPAVRMSGQLLDILEETIPQGAFVVLNNFLVQSIESDTTIKSFIENTIFTDGDVIRIVNLEEENVIPLQKPFIVQRPDWEKEVYLFEVD